MRISRNRRPGATWNLIVLAMTLGLGVGTFPACWMLAPETPEDDVTNEISQEKESCDTCDTAAGSDLPNENTVILRDSEESQRDSSVAPLSQDDVAETVISSPETAAPGGIEMLPPPRQNGITSKPVSPRATADLAASEPAPKKKIQPMVRASRNTQKDLKPKTDIVPKITAPAAPTAPSEAPTSTPALAKEAEGPKAGALSYKLRTIVGSKPEYYVDDNSSALFYGYIGYQLTEALKLDLRQGVTFKEKPDRASDESTIEATDTAVFVAAPKFAEITDNSALSATVRATFGTSDKSRRDKRNGQAKLYLSNKTTFGDLSLSLGLNYAKEFYQETMAADGSRNISHRYEASAGVAYDFTEKFSLSTTTFMLTDTKYDAEGVSFLAELPYVEGKTFNYWNNVEAGYALTQALSIAVGMDTQAPFIDAAGRQQEFYYYKQDVSEWYLDVIYSF